MTARRPWVLGVVRRPWFALLLSLVSAGATAGVAGYFLRSAWTGFSNCPSAGAPGCPSHPFWGLSPELNLIACLLGIGAGALIAVVGGLAFLGRLDRRWAGNALVALSAVGVIAYGGLGVGAAAGVAAGALILRPRISRAGAPSEWSGSLPKGVPPVLGGPKRSLTERPPVMEWDGVLAAAPLGPPGRGRTQVALPPADRLYAALEKGRIAAGLAPRAARPLTSAVVVLPPPPTGVRQPAQPLSPVPPVAGPLLAPAPSPSAAAVAASPGPAVPAPAVASRPSGPTAPAARWVPDGSEISPWGLPATLGPADRAKSARAAPIVPEGLGAEFPALPEAPTLPPQAPPPKTVPRLARPSSRPLTEFTLPSPPSGSAVSDLATEKGTTGPPPAELGPEKLAALDEAALPVTRGGRRYAPGPLGVPGSRPAAPLPRSPPAPATPRAPATPPIPSAANSRTPAASSVS